MICPRRLKAPEDWRTPGRFALFVHRQNSRQRFGLRRPSAAFELEADFPGRTSQTILHDTRKLYNVLL
jgi:hypothetical protein